MTLNRKLPPKVIVAGVLALTAWADDPMRRSSMRVFEEQLVPTIFRYFREHGRK